jgi:hypothetical protein
MTLISIYDQTGRSVCRRCFGLDAHTWQAEALDMFKQAETAAQQGDGASLKGRRATIASVKVRFALLLR